MTDNTKLRDNGDVDDFPEALVDQRRGISLVWLIPLVAALSAAWLGYHSYQARGPLVTIAFETAEGLESGKTRVRFKDVDVGVVEQIKLAPDLSRVHVRARIDPDLAPRLNDKTLFWIVRPRLSGTSVSGLGTLLGGIYIAADFDPDGTAPRRNFEGLEVPPVVAGDQPGTRFELAADDLDRLQVGSPLVSRGIEVGQVVDFGLDEDGVIVGVFVKAPHDRQVGLNTRFWLNPAAEFALEDDGLTLETGSLVTLLVGSLSMGVLGDSGAGGKPDAEHRFQLYPTREGALARQSAVTDVWEVDFDGSVRGLALGAPVELRGIPVGKVTDIRLSLDVDQAAASIPVRLAFEPYRLGIGEAGDDDAAISEASRSLLRELVRRGLRAQLRTGNLLSGSKFIDLDFYRDAPIVEVAMTDGVPILPSVPTPLDELNALVTQLSRLPVEAIGEDLVASLTALRETTDATGDLLRRLDRETASELNATLEQTRTTLASLDRFLKPNAPLQAEAQKMLREFTAAARSLRIMADYLERNPDALLRGKGVSQ